MILSVFNFNYLYRIFIFSGFNSISVYRIMILSNYSYLIIICFHTLISSNPMQYE